MKPTLQEVKTVNDISWKFFCLFLIAFIGGMFVFAKTTHFGFGNAQPRMRVNQSSAITLSTAWQKIPFTGTSTYNLNTFGIDAVSGRAMVYWDATNQIFRFYNNADVNYEMLFSCASSATLLSTPVNVRFRITIPNGVSSGVDIHFPNPDFDGYVDIGTASYIAHRDYAIGLPVYINQAVRTNGFYVEVCISNTSLGTITLDNAALAIQTTNSPY